MHSTVEFSSALPPPDHTNRVLFFTTQISRAECSQSHLHRQTIESTWFSEKSLRAQPCDRSGADNNSIDNSELRENMSEACCGTSWMQPTVLYIHQISDFYSFDLYWHTYCRPVAFFAFRQVEAIGEPRSESLVLLYGSVADSCRKTDRQPYRIEGHTTIISKVKYLFRGPIPATRFDVVGLHCWLTDSRNDNFRAP
ncbi:hypothetical protein ACJ73_00256 [Blastomyces percursus]|uniref:Uncharacterized protein n=1 Tax=Blastomyces percursus TaxID=1658174 RepID=A0A1J9R7F8_9EURO|nr:hypothetical protein ACJ73_00256 [Blastomyces percursus]